MTSERMATALERIADALTEREADPLLAMFAALAPRTPETAQDGPHAPQRLPLPQPGFTVLYEPELDGSFFLLLEGPDGERRPLRW